MRNISFMLTVDQFKNRTKTVTRRLGWKHLKAGDRLMGCRKCQGLKPGEKIERLGVIEVVGVTREELRLVTDQDATREGFPDMTGIVFVSMFCKHMKVTPAALVTRIAFKYIDAEAKPCI